MREYGTIPTQFWLSPDLQNVSNEARLLALYLLSGPHTTMLGCFRLPVGYIAEDLKWSSETVTKGFQELLTKGFITRDPNSNWLLIHDFLQWNPIENPNQGKSIAKLFEQVPTNGKVFIELVQRLLKQRQPFLSEEFCNRLQTLSEQFGNQDQEQDQEQNQEQKQEICVEQRENFVSKPFAAPLITIPLNDKSEFAINQQQVEEWQGLYPAINVLQTLRYIRSWNLANPKKRKTKQGVLNHITFWLTNAHDQGSSRSPLILSSNIRGEGLQDHNFAVGEEWLSQKQKNIIDGEVIHDT